MSEFIVLKEKLAASISKHTATGLLFSTDVNLDNLWDFYLDAFPAGTNEIYRERREYDCTCCRQFIRNIGGAVFIENNKIKSVWNLTDLPSYYQEVADKMAAYVESHNIFAPYLHYERQAGTDYSTEVKQDYTKKWDHFYVTLPSSVFKKEIDMPSAIGKLREDKQMLQRTLAELTIESAEIVMDLILSNSLYRGDEHKGAIEKFMLAKNEYDAVPEDERECYLWLTAKTMGGIGRIRNSSIGTLLVDISEGKALEEAVKAFEFKVAPANYKRTSAPVTKAMILKAQKTLEDSGFMPSIERRFAVTTDLTINNVLYANRSSKKSMNVFDEMIASAPTKGKAPKNVEEVGIEDFLKNILPTTTDIEIFVENKMSSNLMSLIAPVNEDAKHMFKWNNNFSWSYNGEVTDSIKQRVKDAGGNIDADVRASLRWFNSDDLDLSVVEPNGNRICFSNKVNKQTTGELDIDMNAGSITKDPVENIFWKDISKMENGIHTVVVHNFNCRSTDNVGFELELDVFGSSRTYSHDAAVRYNQRITVCKFEKKEDGSIVVLDNVQSSEKQKDIWDIKTGTYQKVSMVLNSPNHWDGNETGNKHTFFIIEGCKNPEDARGFYNEFLSDDLNDCRKAMDMLGGKMRATRSDDQLSGLGFSSTQRNSVLLKLQGDKPRTIKVVF